MPKTKVRNMKRGNDLLDIIIETKPPKPLKDISVRAFAEAIAYGEIEGREVHRAWETDNFGYIFTEDIIYRC